MVLVYEFQVKVKKNEYWNIVLSPQITTTELDMYKRPYVTNGFNMKVGTLHKYGALYPISVAQINRKLSDEMENYVRFNMEVAERNTPKRIVDKNKVKADGMAALKNTRINDVVAVDGNPTNAVVPMQATGVSRENKELFALFQNQKAEDLERIRGEADWSIGVKVCD